MRIPHVRTVFLSLALLLASIAGCRAPATATAPTESGKAPSAEIGSTRNARVAIERGTERAPLTYFARELRESELNELALVAPNVRVVVGLDRAHALERAAEAHGADASFATPEFLRAATNLVWIQAQSAGVER